MKARTLAALAALVWIALAAPVIAAQTPTSERTEIPFKNEPAVSGAQIARVMVAFVLVAGLAIALAAAFKRWGWGLTPKTAAGSRIQVLEIRRLTPKIALFLVSVDGRTLLLGQQGDNVTVLLSEPEGDRQ